MLRERQKMCRLAESLLTDDLDGAAWLRQMSYCVAQFNNSYGHPVFSSQLTEGISPKVQLSERQSGQRGSEEMMDGLLAGAH